MNATSPEVAVIVVHYNTPQLTRELLDSLRQYVAGVDYEVIVVDNGSSPIGRFRRTAHDVRLRPLRNEQNLGFARGVNQAAKATSAPFLLLANSDCRLDDNILTPMLRFLHEHSGSAACSPRLVFPDGHSHSSIRCFPTHRNIWRSRGSVLASSQAYTLEPVTSRLSVEAMAATFMLIRRADFEAIGGFDERFFMYVEDTDLCRRLFIAGKTLDYLGDLTVVHHWGASTGRRLWRMKWQHHRSIRLYFLKHYPQAHLRNVILGMALLINFALVSMALLFHRRRLT